MKKFLLSLFIFLITAFAIQYVSYSTLKVLLDKKSQFRITRYFRSPRHKYFIVGNSRGVHTINEKFANENLKLDLINVSFNGAPYQNVLDIFDDVNSRNTNAVIYFEISCLSDNKFDDAYAYYMADSKFMKNRFAGSVYNWFALLRMNNELFLRNVYYLRKSDNDYIAQNTITPAIIDMIRTDSSFHMFPNKKEFALRLSRLQQTCAGHHNKLILYLAPYYPDYIKKITDYNDVLSYMDSHRDQYKFINLNTVKLANDMFADRLHTNYKGALILTTNLMALSK